MISHGIFKTGSQSTDTLIAKAAIIMDKAWEICKKAEDTPDDSFHDWLTSAINNEGGSIGEFWIHYCSHLRQRAGNEWKGIPPALKANMQEALKGATRVKVYARIAMTPWMDFIFFCDKLFFEEQFLPLLDWQRDAIVAQQTWSVLLNYRQRPSIEMEKQLLPYYRQCAERITAMVKSTAEKAEQFSEQTLYNLGHYLAGLSLWVIPNPVQTDFFRDFLPLLPEKVRGSLAQGMGNILASMPAEKVAQIWGTWLKEYLDLRLVGVPVALSTEETKAMAEWCLYVGDAFPEAVERIVQMPLKGVFTQIIIEKLLTNPVLETFQQIACRYVVAILKGEEYPFLDDKHIQLHNRFKQGIPSTPELREFEESLYLRGWKK